MNPCRSWYRTQPTWKRYHLMIAHSEYEVTALTCNKHQEGPNIIVFLIHLKGYLRWTLSYRVCMSSRTLLKRARRRMWWNIKLGAKLSFKKQKLFLTMKIDRWFFRLYMIYFQSYVIFADYICKCFKFMLVKISNKNHPELNF